MSPNEPDPIFRPSLYLFPTRNSIFKFWILLLCLLRYVVLNALHDPSDFNTKFLRDSYFDWFLFGLVDKIKMFSEFIFE